MTTVYNQSSRDPAQAATISSEENGKAMSYSGTISVVIPVFKAADFVERAVESALREPEVQEVILVEDGSPDGSLAVCRRLAEKHTDIQLLQHPGGANRGAGASRNLGIAAARGKFLAFLDADDYFLPGRFRVDLAILNEQPDLDGVYNAIGTEFYDEVGKARYAGRGQDESHLTTMKRRVEPEQLFEALAPVGTDGHFHADGLTVRRDLFDALDGFDSEMELSQDTLLFLQMALKCRLAPGRLSEPVAIRGVHRANRVADVDRLRKFRVMLFQKLYIWMRRERISANRTGCVWNLYYHVGVVSSNSPELLYLLRHLLMHPEVLFSSHFWRRVRGKF